MHSMVPKMPGVLQSVMQSQIRRCLLTWTKCNRHCIAHITTARFHHRCVRLLRRGLPSTSSSLSINSQSFFLQTLAPPIHSGSAGYGNSPANRVWETEFVTSETIYALSSGHGKCGVAVIRVSGPDARQALCKLGHFERPPKARDAILRTLCDPTSGEALDKGIVIWFPGPHSFTGEDSCELQVHGGPAVVTSILSALSSLPNLRHAEPGDFTKRAFYHGRLDLTEVEGLADLIHAETEAQRQQALRQMSGSLSTLYSQWRQILVKCSANVAAFIDFSEDEMIEDEVMNEVTSSVHKLRTAISQHLSDGRRGERLRDGVRVAIIGMPNVGKSSILNALCRRPAAIVSPIAGTTRDVVESAVNLGGFPVLLSDTAGLRDTLDTIEQEGVRRAKERAEDADVWVVVLDAQQLHFSSSGTDQVQLEDYLTQHLEELGLAGRPTEDLHSDSSRSQLLVIINKSDLVDERDLNNRVRADHVDWVTLSCITESGMDQFIRLLTDKVKVMCSNPSSGNPSLTQARHRDHLTACLHALDAYLNSNSRDLVVAGEYLRRAVYQMGKLTGKITSEEVLDVVFRDFCIGK